MFDTYIQVAMMGYYYLSVQSAFVTQREMHPLTWVTVYTKIWYFHLYTKMKQDFTFCAKQNNFQFLNLDSSKNAQGPSEISFRAFYYMASFMQNNCANVGTMEMLPISSVR